MAGRFFVRTFGCQMNEHDSQRIAADLASSGLERTEDIDEADVIVLNTCCIRQNADNKLYGNLGQLKALVDRRPGVQIAVGGCLAQKDRETIVARAPHVDVVFGTHNVAHAVELLRIARETGSSVVEILDEPEQPEDAFSSALPVSDTHPHAAWVTIQVGCDNSCAFCIVPSVRGPEQSRPFGELVDEVAALARRGTFEVTLLGQNVNSYGRDLTTGLRDDPTRLGGLARLAGDLYATDRNLRPRPLFADLLRAVGAIEGIERVRFTSPHPKDLRPETIAAMAETPEVCEQLPLPLQSGSDRVLRAMRRGYTAARYLERLAAARAAIAGLAVTTDIIVGFPGETDEDFEQTLEVVAEARYDSAYTFIFSPRPGTRAASMADEFVPPEVVSERFARLKAVVDRSAMHAHEARLGLVEEVVVEGASRRDKDVVTGRTRQGKLVHFSAPARLGPGSIATVAVTSAGAHHLSGTLVREVRIAARRVPVPILAV